MLKKNKQCFECGAHANHDHHVIPKSLGGKNTIPLCEACHGIIHNLNFQNHGTLISRALRKKQKDGVVLGRKKTRNSNTIRDLYDIGLSQREIAKIVGCSKTTVHREIIEYMKTKNIKGINVSKPKNFLEKPENWEEIKSGFTQRHKCNNCNTSWLEQLNWNDIAINSIIQHEYCSECYDFK